MGKESKSQKIINEMRARNLEESQKRSRGSKKKYEESRQNEVKARQEAELNALLNDDESQNESPENHSEKVVEESPKSKKRTVDIDLTLESDNSSSVSTNKAFVDLTLSEDESSLSGHRRKREGDSAPNPAKQRNVNNSEYEEKTPEIVVAEGENGLDFTIKNYENVDRNLIAEILKDHKNDEINSINFSNNDNLTNLKDVVREIFNRVKSVQIIDVSKQCLLSSRQQNALQNTLNQDVNIKNPFKLVVGKIHSIQTHEIEISGASRSSSHSR